jgi:hypothetical protein
MADTDKPISSHKDRIERQQAAAKAAQDEHDAREPGKWIVTVIKGGIRISPVK